MKSAARLRHHPLVRRWVGASFPLSLCVCVCGCVFVSVCVRVLAKLRGEGGSGSGWRERGGRERRSHQAGARYNHDGKGEPHTRSPLHAAALPPPPSRRSCRCYTPSRRRWLGHTSFFVLIFCRFLRGDVVPSSPPSMRTHLPHFGCLCFDGGRTTPLGTEPW